MPGYANRLFKDLSDLPAYWRACREVAERLVATVETVPYGKSSRQYVLRLSGPLSRPQRVAFYFHGGAWTFGRPEAFTSAAAPWLTAGFTVILPSYRRPPRVGLEGIAADCRRILVATHPGQQVERLHVSGISAGAHLAALLTARPAWWRAAGWETTPTKSLLCAGPLALGDTRPRSYLGRFPHLDPCQLPVNREVDYLLIHGTHDAMVPYRNGKVFTDRVLRYGGRARLLTLPQGGHLDAGRWMFGGPGAAEVKAFIDPGRE